MTGQTDINWASIPNAVDLTKWPRNKGLSSLFFFASILYVGQFLNGYDGTITGGLQALPSWHADLGNPDANRIGLMNAAAYIVGICMGPINAYVVDRFGRKWPIRWFTITMMLGTIIGVIAGVKQGNTGYALFVVSRAIIGSGIPPFLMTAQIMMQEILLPAIYMLIAVQFVPETPRFLIANGKEEEARAFFVKYHGNGNEDDELVAFEWEEMKATIALENAHQRYSWAQVLKIPGNKHRLGLAALMTFMPQLNGSNIITMYYSVVLAQCGIKGAAQTTGIGAGLNLWSFLLQFAGARALKYTKRRPMVLIAWPMLAVGMAAMGASNGVYAKSGQTNKAAGIASVAMVWIYSIPNNFSQPLFYSYPAEVLNYTLRGKGMAVWNTVNQAWGAYGSYVNSIALANIGWKYYLVFVPILSVQWVLAYFFMVETKGFTLEEIALAFEGPNAAVAKVDRRLAEESPVMDEKKGLEDCTSVAINVV
ncbi:uncharacterized protein IL334_003739 [Kwoniella shivajii]|uniref:Major facilitator superfamily (MFS) profile domain-containing protein n=1 Tax=Kwoniella shivajii TaxID=564305 RepID=A0ABZ1CYD5_9TREE|nr:hypothetical protein IL334_003739 [Kwoniella shivajii]